MSTEHSNDVWVSTTITAEKQSKSFGSFDTGRSVTIKYGRMIQFTVTEPYQSLNNSGTRIYSEPAKVLYVTPEEDRRKELKDEFPKGMFFCPERKSANLRIGAFVKTMKKHNEAEIALLYPFSNQDVSKAHLPKMGVDGKQTQPTAHVGPIRKLPVPGAVVATVEVQDFYGEVRQLPLQTVRVDSQKPKTQVRYVSVPKTEFSCLTVPVQDPEWVQPGRDDHEESLKENRERLFGKQPKRRVRPSTDAKDFEEYALKRMLRAERKLTTGRKFFRHAGMEYVEQPSKYGLKQTLCTEYLNMDSEPVAPLEYIKDEPAWWKSVCRARVPKTDRGTYGGGIMDDMTHQP